MITRLAHLFENAAVHFGVIVGRLGGGGERAARHQDNAAAAGFDGFDLLFIGGDHVVERDRGRRRQLIGADAREHDGARHVAGRRDRAPDQFQRIVPVEPHAALCGVHGFGDAEPERPQMAAKSDRRVPVDRRRQPGVDIGQRIGHNVRRRERDAIEIYGRRRRLGAWPFHARGPCMR